MSTRKLVHKQFNSPIGLYSQQNVKETLNRELKAFGSDGIEIDEQIAKPLNLANSAVLRAVEEEDQQLNCGYKRVAWPPVSEERIVREFTPQPAVSAAAAVPASAAVQPEQYQQQQQQYQPNYQQQQQPAWTGQYQASTAPQYQPQVDSTYNNNHNNNSNSYYAQQRHPQHQPNYQTHQYNIQQNQSANQATYNSNSQFQQQHQQPRAQSLSQDLVDQSPATGHSLPQEYRGGSPGIIQLRKEAPINQKPNLVYTSQPAAVNFQGGSNMRGDLKWPPQEYKEAAAKENEERRKLALGPVCRPRKVNRDYSGFFAKNAINSYYPSYKVPPGTQHMLV